ncbi:ASCH domain-containing protein [Acaryochloris sp. CCMEE 5410]|uniref:ASCH domain-containing protein n=1 Tax=Acaryochloris sp. CCMEE 5410 TaxID=310037 RepID=UPI0002483F82|nr:ASCH domain-containing protein [Acaryochloris sp. CCMEE 5410]KAI9129550.1 ASCH domain-containing protein [Acaryochloris sp. CCMEE 5410]
MKIITLWQPWATFIALNFKQFETRSWGTGYRGKLAIHAAKRHIDPDGKYAASQVYELTNGKLALKRRDYPLGCIVAIADLVDCLQMDSSLISRQTELELAVGNWQPGRFAWQLENIVALSVPIPYRGSQGLRDVRPDVLKILMELTNGE